LPKTPTTRSKLGKILPGFLENRSSVLKPAYERSGKKQEWSDKTKHQITSTKLQISSPMTEISNKLLLGCMDIEIYDLFGI
jgi:hypothetical protein